MLNSADKVSIFIHMLKSVPILVLGIVIQSTWMNDIDIDMRFIT